MHARQLLAGLATTAVALSTLGLTTGSAVAYTPFPQDPDFTPVSADLIGGGSDTTMGAMDLLSKAWNKQTPAPAFKVASYQAVPGTATPPPGTIPLPNTAGEVPRPTSSGSGITMLINQAEADYARSSNGLKDAEYGTSGLRAFPFALDTIQIAVSSSVPSNAPATLTPQNVVDIFAGRVTNWNQVGGPNALIDVKIPPSTSGTRSFFSTQMATLNGGETPTFNGFDEVQEHDDADIKNNPNAIVPFSAGRAGLLKGTVRLVGPWKADRAVYNVVRAADLANATQGPRLQAVFGEQGFICSTAARPLIEQAGFKQLATPARGGVCGSIVQSTNNFALNQAVTTSTKLAVTSKTARTAQLVASVTGSSAPSGTVSFYNGATLLKAGVPLVSGQATATVGNLAPGRVAYRAQFVPAGGSIFEPSAADGAGVVKTSSAIKVVVPKKAAKAGKAVRGTATVTLAGVPAKATGTVKVTKGSKTIASGQLVNGKAKFTLKKGLKAGKNKLRVVWAGDANGVGSTKAATVKVAKAKKAKKKK